MRLTLEDSKEGRPVQDLMQGRVFACPRVRTTGGIYMTLRRTDIIQRLTVLPQSLKVARMRRTFLLSAIALVAFVTVLQAQETKSTMRIEKQHKLPSSMEKRLPEYELNLLKTLENGNPAMQAQAVQTLRDLEQVFPKYSFNASLAPLTAKLKNENTDKVVRRLAALALDELHSDAADAVIRDVANSCDDEGLKTLCNALLVRSQYR